jgi:hypothetical protein
MLHFDSQVENDFKIKHFRNRTASFRGRRSFFNFRFICTLRTHGRCQRALAKDRILEGVRLTTGHVMRDCLRYIPLILLSTSVKRGCRLKTWVSQDRYSPSTGQLHIVMRLNSYERDGKTHKMNLLLISMKKMTRSKGKPASQNGPS